MPCVREGRRPCANQFSYVKLIHAVMRHSRATLVATAVRITVTALHASEPSRGGCGGAVLPPLRAASAAQRLPRERSAVPRLPKYQLRGARYAEAATILTSETRAASELARDMW